MGCGILLRAQSESFPWVTRGSSFSRRSMNYERRPAGLSSCDHEFCITCSDQAIPARVVGVLAGGAAMVDTGETVEEISLDLVEAVPGDVVMVHAGVAIGKLSKTT